MLKLASLFLLSLCLLQTLAVPITNELRHPNGLFSHCGYKYCHKTDPNKLNVHLVPHTHDDVGWLKTVDQYYYGSNTGDQKAGVQYILDNVVRELLANPERRFIYVETAFFWKWLKEQDVETFIQVEQLVQNGRLEFINGGWSMNDEAATHYNSMVDQMTWGLRRLEDSFGQCGRPRIGWQIDPFGHSREQANLFSQFGFDGFFFARMDYQDQSKRTGERAFEMLWRGSDDLGAKSDIFTHHMVNGYGPPGSFCFDLVTCGDDPFIDDPESEDYNVDKKVNDFITASHDYASRYRTNNILFPMGSDFNFQDAHAWYKNMDKLIKYVNAKGSDVNVFYSTPSCYVQDVHNSNVTLPTKSDDFFPYANDDHSYWTGYFTSRPAFKQYERVSNNFLQVTKQLYSLAKINDEAQEKNLEYLKEAMGIAQHHDAVSGTEKQHVVNNYALKLFKGTEKSKTVINAAYQKLLPLATQTAPTQLFCDSLNISACAITESNQQVALTIYNPIGRPVQHLARVPVTGSSYVVTDPQGNTVKSELVQIPDFVLHIPGRVSNATHELWFNASLPAVGFATYFIKQVTAGPLGQAKRIFTTADLVKSNTDRISLPAKSYSVLFEKNGALAGIQYPNGKIMKLTNEFHYYKGMNGQNRGSNDRASGAYIFRPNGTQPTAAADNMKATFKLGEAFGEVHQEVNSWIKQVIRVFANNDLVEVEYVVGPIPVNDNIGKEIIAKFDTNLNNKGVYYTDANGRQVLRRVRNQRPTWTYAVTEPVSGNYYPINSRIFIRDESTGQQFTVLNDRSQGGGSLEDGSVELMVHRRLLHDDAFGVGEPLNEPGVDGKGLVIRGKFYLLSSTIASAAKQHRDLAQQIFLAPLYTFSTYDTEANYRNNFRTTYSGVTQPLPSNVHLLTLEKWRFGSYLVRLEHFYQTNEDPDLSKPATVDLTTLFTPFTISRVTETTLGANQKLDHLRRFTWKTSDADTAGIASYATQEQVHNAQVVLNPMEIRTFVVEIQENRHQEREHNYRY